MRFVIVVVLFSFISCKTKQSNNTTPAPVSSAAKSFTDTTSADTALIISERIDGPANVRDSANGQLLFSLGDNVAVSATEAQNNWLQVGVFVDVTKEEMTSFMIRKDSPILVDGKEIGKALQDIHLDGVMQSNDGDEGELTGYTSVANIRPNTIVENAFEIIVNDSSTPLTEKSFSRLFKDFQFNKFDGLLPQFKGFEIDENWIDDPSPLLRLWVIFDGEKFYGVFHSRPLHLNGATTVKMRRGFYFTTFSHDQKINKQLGDAFNSYIVHVD
jgi:hypothetical protein